MGITDRGRAAAGGSERAPEFAREIRHGIKGAEARLVFSWTSALYCLCGANIGAIGNMLYSEEIRLQQIPSPRIVDVFSQMCYHVFIACVLALCDWSVIVIVRGWIWTKRNLDYGFSL